MGLVEETLEHVPYMRITQLFILSSAIRKELLNRKENLELIEKEKKRCKHVNRTRKRVL